VDWEAFDAADEEIRQLFDPEIWPAEPENA
jgi:hypothetical protein